MRRTLPPVCLLIFGCLAGRPALDAQPMAARLAATPSAAELFERDWVLMNWSLKYYDKDRDILLQPDEARAAAEQFRKLADRDNDGRVTPQEYRIARDLILSKD